MLRRIFATALLAAALQSCAVLTVDVDVYKGPLANQEDVQMEQLAVMAIGARPLLVRLRNDLETDYRAGTQRQCTCSGKDEPRCYTDEVYVADPNCLTSPDARTVNAILGLYLDQPRTHLGALVSEGRAVFDETARLHRELDDFASDRALWSRVAKRADKSAASFSRIATLLNVPEASNGAPSALRPVEQLDDIVDEPSLESATIRFSWLADERRVAAWTTELLPNREDDALRAELSRRLARIGESFLRGRELIDHGLVVGLDFIAAFAADQELARRYPEILAAAIRVTSQLIQPQALVVALNNAAWSERAKIPTELSSQVNVFGDSISQNASSIRDALTESPLEVSLALKAAHLSLKSEFRADDAHDVPGQEQFASAVRRRYGIARSLSLTDSESRDIDDALTEFRALAKLLADLGFDRGRLEKGLETSIEDYLHARDAMKVKETITEDVELARRKLTDALTHFAEKVLFVVNHDSVMRACKGADGECRDSYVMVLEAIGNSILTLNDELRQTWSAEQRASSEAERERGAVLAAWRLDPAGVLDEITRAILADITAAQPDVTEKEKLSKNATKSREAAETAHKDIVSKLGEPPKAQGTQNDATKAATGGTSTSKDKTSAANDQQEPAWDKLTAATAALREATSKQSKASTLNDAWKRAKTREIVQEWSEDECHGSDVSQYARLRDLATYVECRIDKLRKQKHGDNDDVVALLAVVEWLKKPEKIEDTPRTPCDVALANVTSVLETAVKDADKSVADKTKVKQDADALVTGLTTQEKDTKEALTKATDAESEAKKNYDKVAEPLNAKKLAVELIQKTRDATLEAVKKELQVAAATGGPSGVGRQRVRALLYSTLLAQPDGKSPTKAEYEAAARVVAAVHISDLPDPSLGADAQKPTQVLDEISATLRHELVVANAQGDKDRAEQIQQALKTAESYRSPMVYIRPPASFLRNSSPVTSLQYDSGGETNELLHSVQLANPFAGPDKEQEARRKTQLAIDQQFWQNINRVRVSGGGDTTYALVKDDIGNWYVKGYSGDPKSVIHGFTSMALAAGSGAMQSDLIARAKQIEEAKQTGKAIDAKASPTVLGRQVDHFEGNYDDRTEADAKRLGGAVPKLADEIKAAWKKLSSWSAVDDLATAGFLKKNAGELEALANEPAKPLAELPALPTEKGEKQATYCVTALKTAADYQEALLERLSEKKLVDDAGVAAKRVVAATKQGELTTAENNLAVAKGRVTALEQVADPSDAVKDQLTQARTERDQIAGQVDQARAALATARAELGAAEAKLTNARDLVHDMRKSVVEKVGVAMQHEIDKRVDAVEDYQEALQVLGQRPKDQAATP